MRGWDDGDGGRLGTPRRALLITGLAGAAAALGGCWPGGAKSGAQAPPHPLAAPLAQALALVSLYDVATAAQPGLAGRLAPLRADHWAHVGALSAAMGRKAPSSAPGPAASATPPADARTALAGLRGAERTAQADAVTACVAAPAGYAAMLGSIAACRATHLEVLSA